MQDLYLPSNEGEEILCVFMVNMKLFQAARHPHARHVVLRRRLAARAGSLSRSGRGRQGEGAVVFRTTGKLFLLTCLVALHGDNFMMWRCLNAPGWEDRKA